MKRERALKIVLVLVGLLFCAAVYPLVLMAKQDPALAMMMSIYVTLGVFLAMDLRQLLFRPTPSLYRTPRSNLYLCGASTPPGGGVHGMTGYHAAMTALAHLTR